MIDPPPPSLIASATSRRWSLAMVPIAALLFMGLCYVSYQPLWERAFRSDDSPVSWLSSALLFANAIVALALTLTASIPARLGKIMSAGLLWCSLDEQFMFHERFKYDYIPTWIPTENPFTFLLENLPMLAVGLGGSAVIACFLRGMRRTNIVTYCLMLTALAFGFIAIIVDLWGENWWITPFEEGIEVLAESFFLSALLETAQVQSKSS